MGLALLNFLDMICPIEQRGKQMTEQAQSKVRFTPGQWFAECVGTSSAGPDGVDVYEVNNGHTRIAEHMTEGDARLIAAAPELYEALKNARSMLTAFGGDPRRIIAEHGSPSGDEMQAALLDQIDATLAKVQP